mmetsp:Transcript_40661/g.126749  ORF Transcript_40661/g.126749 Transcript_40661/m.126749 type:complete len:326 (-) Transcript_40661:676-1653(-)
MASRTPTSGTIMRGHDSASLASVKGAPPALDPRDLGAMGGSVTPPEAAEVTVGIGDTPGVADDVVDGGCTIVNCLVKRAGGLVMSLASSPRPVRNRAEDDLFDTPDSALMLLSSSNPLGDPTLQRAMSSSGKGDLRMKERGSSELALKSWSIFARRSRRICSSSSSDRSSSRIPDEAGRSSGPPIVSGWRPPGVISAGYAPAEVITSWFVPSSSMPTCDADLRRRPGPTSCIDRTLRIFCRFSFNRGSVAFFFLWKQPPPSRYHGFLAQALIATPGMAPSRPGPEEQGLSFRFSARRDWNSLRAGRLPAPAISLDDRSRSSRAGK